MVARPFRQRLNLPLAPIAAAVIGLTVAAGVLLTPTSVLEALVMDSGAPALISAAEPPLGMTARIALALAGGIGAAILAWFGLFVLLGSRTMSLRAERPADVTEIVPVIRRADAHPDAPPRPPVLATRDLGTPFLDVRAPASDIVPEAMPEPEPVIRPVGPPPVQSLPADLDMPLAAFDPGALRKEPIAPAPPVAPLRWNPRPAVFEETERFETFEITPPVRTAPPAPEPIVQPEAITAPETDATIHALLERLERGVTRRGVAPVRQQPEHGLEDALTTLRKLAMRA
jgi:hypothetical protein